MMTKQQIFDHIKNVYGWKTKRKILVISVDDYGNVRLDSKKARLNLDKLGCKVETRFDALDTLENKEDLEMLFEALTSVKDQHGNYAIFTPFALPCNIDFEKIIEENFINYQYETLPTTYQKLSNLQPKEYEGTWALWQEGIKNKLLKPQFHGREHLNLKIFEEKLKSKDHELISALKNRSYTSISNSGYPTISVTAAFEFWKFEENTKFESIIEDGLDKFEEVYGYKSVHFNSPGGREHPIIHKILLKNGIKYIDTPFLKKEHQGNGNFKNIINHTGKRNHLGQLFEVRNVVFEPTDSSRNDWVEFTLKQIETAFFWNKPAIISSHRVNFCGHIDPLNRKKGTSDLQKLLKEIVIKWPEIEFMSADQLGNLISTSN